MNNLGLEIINENEVVVSSLQIAEVFEKSHNNVLSDIKNLTARNSAVKTWYHESSYRNERNREYPMYLMNEKGFSFLVMGYTGEKADSFKIQYINAFSEMEKELKQPKALTTSDQIRLIAQGNTELDERLTKIEMTYPVFPGEAKHLKQIINSKISEVLRNKFNSNQNTTVKRKLYSAIYRSLYTAFQVPNYASIPRGQYERAITFLETWQPASETVYQIELILDSEAVVQ